MQEMGVQGQHERWSFLDDSDPRMFVSVDAALVSFRLAKPPLQLQIVMGPIRPVSSHEQARLKTGHHFTHLLLVHILAIPKLVPQGYKLRLPTLRGAVDRIQQVGDVLNILDLAANFRLGRLDSFQASVDAPSQTLQLIVAAPPFFASRFRWRDSRTSPKASAIRRPEGWSGPPWSSLRMPRTAAQ
jgi:hypothetical protein